MKALLPVFCRPLGYVILVISMFIPFLLLMQGMVTDSNLLFYKECIKLLMILGAMMIIFALSRNEGRETEIIRNKATRNAIFLTVLFFVWRDALSGSNRRYHDRRYLFFSYFSYYQCTLP